MKIGVCGGVAKAPIIKALGYDYVEENMFKIASLSESEFNETVEFYKNLDIPVYSFNGFFGGDITIYGEGSLDEIREYAALALKRAHALGGKVCVIGSGKARAIPDGVSLEFARERFVEVVSICCDIADGYGIRIVVEPLNSGETNFINTVSEAAEIAKLTGKRNAGSLVDFFHFAYEKENDGGIVNNGDTLMHAHLARPDDRYAPKLEDAETVARWIGLLKSINYTGALSVESKYKDFEAEITEARKCFDGIVL